MRSVAKRCLSVLVLLTVLVLVWIFFFFFFLNLLIFKTYSSPSFLLPLVKLIKQGDEIVGVEYTYKGETKQEFGVVIIATGGFGHDFSADGFLAKYKPEVPFPSFPSPFSSSSPL